VPLSRRGTGDILVYRPPPPRAKGAWFSVFSEKMVIKMENKEFEEFYKYISQFLVGENEQIKLIYAGIKASQVAGTVPAFLLRGPPGAGKTYVTKIIANYYNTEYVFVQTTLNTTEDELVYKYLPSETTKSGIRIMPGPLPEALKQSKQKLTVLTIDEFDKTRPSADALLLDFLQNARISFRIDEHEEMIEGNKSNIIVFITSNDNRDFSEPLLRRLIVVEFQPPSPQAVETLLSKEFKDPKIVKLLAKIYIAGLHAGLSKPITIQELKQFGKAIEIMPNAPFNDLVYSFLVKNAEDMSKLEEAIRDNKNTENQEENAPDVGQALEQQLETEQEHEAEQEQEERTSVQEILTRIKVPENTPINAEKITETEEKTFNGKINKDFKEYSEVIKTFEPTPAERPDVLGKFKVVLDDTELKLTSSTPLTLHEVQKLAETQMNFEAYIEDNVYFQNNYNDIINIVKGNNLNFTYYTRTLIIAKNENSIIRLEALANKFFKLKMYINKKTGEYKKLLNTLLSFQENVVLKNFINNLPWYTDIINGKFFNSQQYKDMVEFIETTRLEAKLIIEAQQLFVSVGKGAPEARYDIANEANSNSIKFIIRRIDVATEKASSNISSDVKNIVSKYVGTYNLLEGLQQLKNMNNEIQSLIQ